MTRGLSVRERLDALRAQYESAEGAYKKTIRQRARDYARCAGYPCPPWARSRNDVPAAPIEVPRDMPAPLRAFIARTAGTIVHISRSGVEIHVFGQDVVHYPTVEAAVRAVT